MGNAAAGAAADLQLQAITLFRIVEQMPAKSLAHLRFLRLSRQARAVPKCSATTEMTYAALAYDRCGIDCGYRALDDCFLSASFLWYGAGGARHAREGGQRG